MLPIRASAFLLAVALTLVGCSMRSQPPEPTATPTAALQVAPTTPTPRPPASTATPIPAPNTIGRVTPPPTPTLRPGAATRLSLALGGPPSAGQIGLFVARERGYFLEGELELFFHATGSSAVALSSLSGERDQLALVGGDDVLRARARGTPVVSVLALDGRGPDGYELVIATTESLRSAAAPALKAFAVAAARGYAEAARDPGIAVDALARVDSTIDREAAARQVGEVLPFWRAAGPFGLQDDERWRAAHRRLVALGLAPLELDVASAFTNELALAAAPTPTVTPSPTPRPTVAPPRPTPPAVAPAAPKPAAPQPATPTPAAPRPPTVTPAPAGAAPPSTDTPRPSAPAPPPPTTPTPATAPPPALQPAPTARIATP